MNNIQSLNWWAVSFPTLFICPASPSWTWIGISPWAARSKIFQLIFLEYPPPAEKTHYSKKIVQKVSRIDSGSFYWYHIKFMGHTVSQEGLKPPSRPTLGRDLDIKIMMKWTKKTSQLFNNATLKSQSNAFISIFINTK
jgi:hypothetical protein